jgi:hypothetical protein
MKLKQIIFDEEESAKEIVVSMSVKEAVWIALVAGNQRGESPHSEIHNCLCGAFFNKLWDDGVDDANREHGVVIPPIVYPTED